MVIYKPARERSRSQLQNVNRILLRQETHPIQLSVAASPGIRELPSTNRTHSCHTSTPIRSLLRHSFHSASHRITSLVAHSIISSIARQRILRGLYTPKYGANSC